MTYLAYSLLERVAESSQRALSRLSRKPPSGVRAIATGSIRPTAPADPRLEEVFTAMSELPFQPHIAAALGLGLAALEAELPCTACAAGLHDIDSDEIRIVAAQGEGHELLRGSALPLRECVTDRAMHAPDVVDGTGVGSLLANEGVASNVLLCPILHQEHLLGVLTLADPLCAARFEERDIELVRYVADQLASFIHEHRQRPAQASQGA